MHFGGTYPWLSLHDAKNPSRVPSVETVKSKARRPLPTEPENRHQMAIMSHYSGCSDGAWQAM